MRGVFPLSLTFSTQLVPPNPLAPTRTPRPYLLQAADLCLVPVALGAPPPPFGRPDPALAAGADALKLFPAEIAGPKGLKAVRAVLPPATRIYPVGGVDPDSMAAWRSAGASGFGIGSGVFKPGQTPEQTGLQAADFVTGWSAF
mgnify:CR=1 FL=1